jgi:TfoX/Sxy family transcriptional regulator of competence genes
MPDMPTMPKPSPEAIARFKAIVPDDPRVSLRPMFGNLSAFANGYMFAGLFGEATFVRLDDAGQAAMIERGGRPFEVMAGRPMRGYVVVPDSFVGDPAAVRDAVAESLAHTLALPPKAPKPSPTKKK